MRTWLPLLLPMVLALACTPKPAPQEGATEGGGGSPGGTPPLLASLQATTAGEEVRLVLQVTNTTAAPIELRFASGQTHDFLVLQGGRELWRWSADRMFTQALRSERLAPGATLTFEAVWAAGAARGELTAVGQLTSTSHPLEQRAAFRLP